MRYLILLGWILTWIGCGGEAIPSELASSCSGTSLAPGLVCVGGFYQSMKPGMCNSASDCPPPYNTCNSTNTCAIQQAFPPTYYAFPSRLVWFATDSVRPGGHAPNTAEINNTDYVFNIMAKGYASLDDWCLSQAQQSTLASVRNIVSWTALIIAQPDGRSVAINDLSSRGIVRFYALLLLTGDSAISYNSPLGEAFSSAAMNMYDKNGSFVNFNAWSGINNKTCQSYARVVQSCTKDSTNQHLVIATQSNVQIGPVGALNNRNDVVANGNSWSSDQGGDQAASIVAGPGVCSVDIGQSPIAFVNDCDGRSDFHANCGNVKPILCLANQY